MSIRQGLQQHRLMIEAYQLLQKNVRQSELLNRLETLYPSITKVKRDSDGAIRIDRFHGNPDQLKDEISTSLEKD